MFRVRKGSLVLAGTAAILAVVICWALVYRYRTDPLTYKIEAQRATTRIYVEKAKPLILELDDWPEYMWSLQSVERPFAGDLNSGVWLMIFYSVWSTNTNACIRSAISAVMTFHGEVSVGVRVFEDPKEITKWYPSYDEDNRSPVWMIVRDGEVVETDSGWITPPDWRRRLRKALRSER